jgi:hypothetical protein
MFIAHAGPLVQSRQVATRYFRSFDAKACRKGTYKIRALAHAVLCCRRPSRSEAERHKKNCSSALRLAAREPSAKRDSLKRAIFSRRIKSFSSG